MNWNSKRNVICFLLDDSSSIEYLNISNIIRNGINDIIRKCLEIDPDVVIGVSTLNRGFLGWTQWVSDRLNVYTYNPQQGSEIHDAIVKTCEYCGDTSTEDGNYNNLILVILVDGPDVGSHFSASQALDSLKNLQEKGWEIIEVELGGANLLPTKSLRNMSHVCLNPTKKNVRSLMSGLASTLLNLIRNDF
jgi:hypothetical protein